MSTTAILWGITAFIFLVLWLVSIGVLVTIRRQHPTTKKPARARHPKHPEGRLSMGRLPLRAQTHHTHHGRKWF